MDQRIAIDFGGRGLQDLRLYPFGETEHVDRAVHARLRRLHRIMLIMNGRGRASEIVDLVHLDIERKRHVVPEQFETRMREKMLDIPARAGKEIIDAYDHRAVCK
jgi:hypothetical protein